MPKLWGWILITGALIVGGVIIWLFAYYVREGIFTTTVGIIAAVAGMLILVLPQIVFGIYILRYGQRLDETNPPDSTV